MAVFPKKLSLTRDQFASFLQDFEQIKQFEQLFSTTNANSISIDDVNISAGNAGEGANDALAQIIELSETLNKEPSPANVSQLAVIETQLQNLAIIPPANIGSVTSVAATGGSTGLTFSGSPITTSGTLILGGTLAVASGGTGAITAALARTNLGASTLGSNVFTITDPSAITFPRFNADNTVSALDAATFRTAIGAGTGSGSVTSVSGTGTVNGITLTGTVTTSGSLTLGGTLSNVSLTSQVTGTLPIANGGTNGTSAPTAGAVPYGTGTAYAFSAVGTSGQVLTSSGSGAPTWTTPATGTVTSVTGTAPVVSSGGSTPAISMAAATASVNGYLTSTDWNTFNSKGNGTVTSVSGTGSVNGITLTGTVTSSGSLTLGGTLSGVNLTSQVTGVLPVANGGTGTSTSFTTGSIVFAGASGIYSQDNTNLFWDDTNNRLGVGTPTPGATIDVAGNIRMSAGSPNIELNNGGPMVYSPAGNTLSFATGGGPSTPQEKFRIGSSGQWGIGGATYGTSGQVFTSGGSGAAPTWTTPTTGTVTSVSGTGSVNGITLTGTVTSSGNITLGGTLSGVSLTSQVSGTLPVSNGGTGATTLTSGYLVKGNGTSAVSASVVYETGTNIGIGTTSPVEKLRVEGNVIVPIAKSFFSFTSDYGVGTPDSSGLQLFAGGGDNIRFGHRSGGTFTERTRIDSSGNFIINAGSLQTKANGSTALANALNDNVAITVGTGFMTFTGGGAAAQLGGMVAGSDGQRVVILNTTGGGIVIIGESGTSTVANRIWTPGLAPTTWNNLGTREFIYSAAQQRWLMIGSSSV